MASTILFRKGLRSGCYPLRPFATRSSRMHTTLTPSPPKAIPLVYHLDKDLKPISTDRSSGALSGYFLMQASEQNDPQKSYEVMEKGK